MISRYCSKGKEKKYFFCFTLGTAKMCLWKITQTESYIILQTKRYGYVPRLGIVRSGVDENKKA